MLSQIAGLASANLFGPLISLASTPVLSRLYDPNAFGVFYFFLTLSMVLATVASGQIFHGISTTQSLVRARLVLVETVLLSLLVSGVIFLGLLGTRDKWAFDALWIAFSVSACLTYSVSQALTAYYVRLRKVRLVSLMVLMKSLFVGVFQVGLGYIFQGKAILLGAGYVLGEALSLSFLMMFLDRRGYLVFARLAFRNGFQEVRRNSSFFFHYMPSQFLSLLINFSPVFLLKSLEAFALLGAYSMTVRLVTGPVNSVAVSVRATFWRLLADGRKELRKGAMKPFLLFSSLNVLFFAFLMVLDYPFASMLLGAEWGQVDNFLPYAVLWAGASFAAIFPVEVVKNTGGQKWILWGEALAGGIKVVSLLLAWVYGGVSDYILYAWFLSAFFSSSVISILYLILINRRARYGQ